MDKISNINFKGINNNHLKEIQSKDSCCKEFEDKSAEMINVMEAQGNSAKLSVNSLDKKVEKLRQRLEMLDITTNGDSHRFGIDGVKSILDLATSEENIAIINAKLDELEDGKDIWTYDITSSITPHNSQMAPKFLEDGSVFEDNTMFKEIYTTPSSNPEVISLEDRMKSMGYKANFSDNLETAQIIANAYEKMTKAGFKMPEEVILMTPSNPAVLGFRPYAPHNQRYSTPIYFNKDLIRKNDAPFILSDIGIQHNSTDTPESVVYHEIGHFLNEETAPEPEIAIDLWKKEANDGMDLEMAREVGFYAMNGDKFHMGREFVAEVFAGLMDGKHYSQKVMDLYHKLGGPDTNLQNC